MKAAFEEREGIQVAGINQLVPFDAAIVLVKHKDTSGKRFRFSKE